jgi:hypothetical protein
MSGLSARKVPERPLRETVRGLHAKKGKGANLKEGFFMLVLGAGKNTGGFFI